MSAVLSSQCEHREFTEGKTIPMRRREKYEILFSLPPHISHVSIEGCVWDIHWVGGMQVTKSGLILAQILDIFAWSLQDVETRDIKPTWKHIEWTVLC